ncbi:MAG: hypothetical protein VB081_14630 [Christensenella sp.]|uniref:hypothetical protein n=1 Tax=Christensenella sp. TaxID=1935934 RepID=UPI002B1F1EF0|nr:hypothetical protein [Christensenella sp.]MEA5004720.1 hypothetical protein [Christensenella sp.]
MALPEGLLVAVKNYLDITWEDVESDKKIAGITERGVAYIDRIAGKAMDYTIEGSARALLFDYVRYVRSGALNIFMDNYCHELIALQMDEMEVPEDEIQVT